MIRKSILAFLASIISLDFISAHCPLCTIGAGAAAAGAVWLGISKVVVALFIGAFAMSMGYWFSNLIKKKYIPFQRTLIILIVFATTLIPLLPIFSAIGPLYLPFGGNYGQTYAVDYSIFSGLFGGLVILVSPKISEKLTNIRRGKIIPFQGIVITFLLLILTGGLIQLGV